MSAREPRQALPKESVDEAGQARIDVGRNLRRLRRASGLSLRSLAERSRLAVNTLSLIENNRTSPSVSTLQQLAIALEEPITSFFESDRPKQRVSYVKADRGPKATFDHGALEDLGAGLRGRALEPILVTLRARADSGSRPIVHTGLEFVYCLQGTLEYDIEGESYRLEPGDSLLFEAHLPHRWQNPESDPARAILVLSPSDEHDRPTDRHFLLPGSTAGQPPQDASIPRGHSGDRI